MKDIVVKVVTVAEVLFNLFQDIVCSQLLFVQYCQCINTLLCLENSVEQSIGQYDCLIKIEQVLSIFRVIANKLVVQYWNALQSLSDKISCCI
ncbi:hypothetical protein FGO68_gene14303 [Halteria grandinella]|uniref:Uncharacterized protein n=1 Tax=Halteria grandinella TaxID=5974 RepID=A0A8J8P0C5_HALGN|nr:hypothetical protein FGO68_gene14303 [Halteria grandinella]